MSDIFFDIKVNEYFKSEVGDIDLRHDVFSGMTTSRLMNWLITAVSYYTYDYLYTYYRDNDTDDDDTSVLYNAINNAVYVIKNYFNRKSIFKQCSIEQLNNYIRLNVGISWIKIYYPKTADDRCAVETSYHIAGDKLVNEIIVESVHAMLVDRAHINMGMFYTFYTVHCLFVSSDESISQSLRVRSVLGNNKIFSETRIRENIVLLNKTMVTGVENEILHMPSSIDIYKRLNVLLRSEISIRDFFRCNGNCKFMLTDYLSLTNENLSAKDIIEVYTPFSELDGHEISGVKLSHYHFTDDRLLTLFDICNEVYVPSIERAIIDGITFVGHNNNKEDIFALISFYFNEYDGSMKLLLETATMYNVPVGLVETWVFNAGVPYTV